MPIPKSTSDYYASNPNYQKTTADLAKPDRTQSAIVYDLISEGPIDGLVNGANSIYLNDIPLVDKEVQDIIGPRFVTCTTTASSTTVTLASGDLPDVSTLPDVADLSAAGTRVITIIGAAAAGSAIASGTSGNSTVTTSSSFFTSASIVKQGSQQKIRIAGAGPDGSTYVGVIKSVTSATEAEVFPELAKTVSSANISVDLVSAISSYDYANDQITLATAPGVSLTSIPGSITSSFFRTGEDANHANFDNVISAFKVGDAYQTPLPQVSGLGNASYVISPNYEIKQTDLDRTEYNLPANYNVHLSQSSNTSAQNGGSSASYTQVSDTTDQYTPVQGQQADTVIQASTTGQFGLGVPDPAEIDEVKLTFSFPQLIAVKPSSGAEASSFVEFQIFFEWTNDGTNYNTIQTHGPTTSSISQRKSNFGEVTFTVAKNAGGEQNGQKLSETPPNNGYVMARSKTKFVEEFRINTEYFQPYSDFRIRIRRLTANNPGGQDRRGDFGHQNSSFLSSVEAIVKDRLNYPYTAYAALGYSAEQFNSAPKRSYHVRGKLIQVPTNYFPIYERTSSSMPSYNRNVTTGAAAAGNQDWDGNFRGDISTFSSITSPNHAKVYSNNPAWVFYDLLLNKNYGLGEYIEATDIDKYALYSIAKYCDELVPDGKGGEEPRFTANVYLGKAADAQKVLQDFASIFRGILYWLDGKIVPVSDRQKTPVYTFTKGNVIEGQFTYEGSGDKTRVNQVKVTWNDPDRMYEQQVEIVEDTQNILETNRIIPQNVVAFGATSQGQAHRWGKWHLLSAKLEKEMVQFKTGLNAAFLRPGELIWVQDEDKYQGVQFSGRVSNSGTRNTTTVPLDRSVTLVNGVTYYLYLVYPKGGAYLAQDTATINSTVYTEQDLVIYDEDGVEIDTAEKASKVLDDDGNIVQLHWHDNTRVEKRSVSNSAGSTSSITVGTAYSDTPNTEVIWLLQGVNADGSFVNGSPKEYRIISVSEDSKSQTYEISATEYINSKFDTIDRGYDIYQRNILPNNQRGDIIPVPVNVVASHSLDGDVDGTDDVEAKNQITKHQITLSWEHPTTTRTDVNGNTINSKYEHLEGYEIETRLGGRGIEKQTFTVGATENSITFNSLDPGKYLLFIRTRSVTGAKSKSIKRSVNITGESTLSANKVDKLVQGGQLNQTLTLSSSTATIGGSGTYSFITPFGETFSFTSTGTGNYQQDFTGMGASKTAYLIFDASDTSDHLKAGLIYTDTTAVNTAGQPLRFSYWQEVGASSNGITTTTGTVTIAQNSNKVEGSSTTFNTDYSEGDLIKVSSSTTAEYARIAEIRSDTLLFTEQIFTRSHSAGTAIGKQSWIPDFNRDCIISTVVTDGSTNYTLGVEQAITAGIVGADGADGSDGTDARAVNLTVGDQTIEYDTNGANPNPSSTTVTATALNTSGTVYYEFFKNDVSVQNTTSNTYSYSAPSSYTSMPEKIEAQIREGSNSGTILARDQITISGLKAGTNAITTVLSNEAHTLPTTSGGVVTYTGSGTDIEVWNGTTQVPYDGSSPYASPSFRVSASGTSITPGSASTVSTYIRRFADHSNMTADNAAITYTIIVKNEAGVENTFTRKQTFAKSIQGADGSPGSTGPRTATGYIYYQSSSASSPTGGSAVSTSSVSYNFSSSLLSGGVIGTGSTNWNQNPPTFTGSNANKYWYAYYSVIESSYGGSYTVTFSIPYEGQNFTGLVTFTGTNTISDGTNTTTALVSSDLGSSGTTTIDGGRITTGTIDADRITLVGKNISDLTNNSGYVDSSGASAAAPVQSVGGYTGTVSVANLSSAGLYLSSNPSGYVNTSQAAAAAPVQSVGGYTGTVSVANLSAAGLTLTSSLSDAATTTVAAIRSGTTSSDVGLGNVSNYSPSNQVINGWNTTITAGAIKLGNSSGARIELDATSSNPRILIVDAT